MWFLTGPFSYTPSILDQNSFYMGPTCDTFEPAHRLFLSPQLTLNIVWNIIINASTSIETLAHQPDTPKFSGRNKCTKLDHPKGNTELVDHNCATHSSNRSPIIPRKRKIWSYSFYHYMPLSKSFLVRSVSPLSDEWTTIWLTDLWTKDRGRIWMNYDLFHSAPSHFFSLKDFPI